MEVSVEHLPTVYQDRNLLVQLAAQLAKELGYLVQWGEDLDSPGWPVLYIKLPLVGQVSWHIPEDSCHLSADSGGIWDHHSNEEKEERIKNYLLSTQTSKD